MGKIIKGGRTTIEKLILVALFICVVATVYGQGKPEYKIEVDLTHSGPFQEVVSVVSKEFSHENTADGYRFFGPNGLTFDWAAPKIRPQVSVVTTTMGDRFRYEIVVANDKAGKDPIRSVSLSWRPLQLQSTPEFSEPSTPVGWENTGNLFTGLLPPGKSAAFVVWSTLVPEQAMLLVSGVDQTERGRQNEVLVGQGATTPFFIYISQIVGFRDYVVYEVSALLKQ